MAERSDGGPAFPRPMAGISEEMAVSGLSSDAQEGMTLRDYFAGEALHAMMANPEWVRTQRQLGHAERAEVAYQQADAMLAERSRRG